MKDKARAFVEAASAARSCITFLRVTKVVPQQSLALDLNFLVTERWAGAVALGAMPTLGAKNAPKMGHPDLCIPA